MELFHAVSYAEKKHLLHFLATPRPHPLAWHVVCKETEEEEVVVVAVVLAKAVEKVVVVLEWGCQREGSGGRYLLPTRRRWWKFLLKGYGLLAQFNG
jgi:hypothetical protein